MKKENIVIFFIIFAMCYVLTTCRDPTPVNYKLREVTVTLANFRELNIPKNLNFTPTYVPNNGDITYTLIDDKGHSWNGESFDGIVSYSLYNPSSLTTVAFTQVFYRGGEALGRLVIKADVISSGFMSFKDANNRALATLTPSLKLQYIEYAPSQ